MTDQGRTLSAAARAATGGWGGSAATAYIDYSGRVVAYGSAAAAAYDRAASALSVFGEALASAQTVARQAFADCDRFQAEMNAQQVNIDTAKTAAQIASGNAILAPHEPARAAFQRDLAVAEQDQVTAQAATDAAERELQAAQQRGRQAFEGYQDAVRAVAGTLEASAGELRGPPLLPGGAPVPIAVTTSDAGLAADMLERTGSLGVAATALADRGELARLSGGRLTPGAALRFAQDFEAAQELAGANGKTGSGGIADRFGGEIHGITGFHLFGNSSTPGYELGDRLGSIATDTLVAVTCVAFAAPICVAAGAGVFFARTGGAVQDSQSSGEFVKTEASNALEFGLTAAPGAAVGIVPGVVEYASTSGSFLSKDIAAERLMRNIEERMDEAGALRVGEQKIPMSIPVKALLEGTGLATGQGLAQAKASANGS